MQRKPDVQKFTFTASTTGVTHDGKPMDIREYACVGIHATAGLAGRTITFSDNGEWGADSVLSKLLIDGFNPLTSDDLLRIGSAMELTAELDDVATGDCFLKLKS